MISLPATIQSDISEFCAKNKIPFQTVDEKYAIEDFFKEIIDKYLDLSMYTDEKIQKYIESEIESAESSKYEEGWEEGKEDGYDSGYDEGFQDGVNAQERKAEKLGKK